MEIKWTTKEDELICLYEMYENRTTFWKNFKEVAHREREETRNIKEARNLFINEACQNILVGRRENMEMDDEAYSRMIKNAQLEIDAAEKLDRILNNRFNQFDNITDKVADAAGGVGEMVSDVILKTPTYAFSSKVGGIVRRIFGGKSRR